jgi:spermidine synthase
VRSGRGLRPAARLVGVHGSSLVFRQRDGIVEILAGNVVLLSSAALGTELALGRLAASVLGRPPRRVLIGGLGFGATLRGVLDVAPVDAEVFVAEKVAAIEPLVRGDLAHVAGRPLDDTRARVTIEDVGDVLARREGDLDVILLDVDNGPHWASFRSNARLYTPAGLAAAHRALAPEGALLVWSGYPADAFLGRLRAAGFVPSRVLLRESQEQRQVRARAYVGIKRG